MRAQILFWSLWVVLVVGGAPGSVPGAPPTGGKPTVPPDANKPGIGAAVDVSFQSPQSKPASGGERLIEVVASGAGTDPEKATQAAFWHAIEQAVGILVDAETIVKNDQIIRDQILTYSRGFVQKFEVVKQWQEGGLHYARIKALVEAGKVSEKLKAQKIAVREVPGELMYRQAIHELTAEETAAEMLKKALEDYTMEKIYTVEIVGKPETIEKDQTHAKLKVRVQVSANLENWQKLCASIRPLLGKIASASAAFSTARKKIDEDWGGYGLAVLSDDESKLKNRLKGKGLRIYLFKSKNETGSQTDWDAFLVNESLARVLQDVRERENGKTLSVSLLDAKDQEVLQVKRPLKVGNSYKAHTLLHYYDAYWMGPVLCWGGDIVGIYYSPAYVQDVTIEIELTKLRDVVKVAACMEKSSDKKK